MKKPITIFCFLCLFAVGVLSHQQKKECVEIINNKKGIAFEKDGEDKVSKLKNHQKNNDTLKEQKKTKATNFENNHILGNGYFIDLLIGGGSYPENTGINFMFGFRMGNKFYFGDKERYRPGLSLNYAGVQGQLAPSTFLAFTFTPVGVGFTNAFQFTENLGLEANFNLNIAISGLIQEPIYIGAMINPTVKFRYKSFSVGFNADLIPSRNFSIADNKLIVNIGLKAGFKF